MKSIIPSVPELGREALIVVGGAVIAALVMSQFPALRAWIRKQWTE